MKPLLIVKVEIVSQSTPSRGQGVIVVEIDLLILDTAPEPFNEDVVKMDVLIRQSQKRWAWRRRHLCGGDCQLSHLVVVQLDAQARSLWRIQVALFSSNAHFSRRNCIE